MCVCVWGGEREGERDRERERERKKEIHSTIPMHIKVCVCLKSKHLCKEKISTVSVVIHPLPAKSFLAHRG